MPLPIQKLGALAARIGFGLVAGPGGATEAVVFHLGKAAGGYDVTTDTITPTGGTDYPLAVVAFKKKEAQTGIGQERPDNQFTSGTTTFLVQAADLPPGTLIQETDTVTRADTTIWAIVGAELDPSGATWLVDVRK